MPQRRAAPAFAAPALMLRITNLVLARGAKRLLDGASMTVHDGHKIGLIGANGAGKSSLFALLRGELVPDAGNVELPAAWTIAHVAQETPDAPGPAIEFVQDGDAELRTIQRQLALAEAAHDADPEAGGQALAELHHRFEAIGGYAARARAAMLLSGLGFASARHEDPVASFSGGWRMRLNLAQALMCRSDLLLLDEPTNHLDLDAVLWLEDWLGRYPGTLLLITHDRDFLDGVVNGIVHVDQQKLKAYGGNYSQFERERAQQLALQQASFVKQQRQIAHLQSFVDRFRAKATKAKQAQSRIKALERMERIAAAHVDSPFEFTFAPSGLAARQLVRLEHATLGYAGAPPILAGLDWNLLAGERIGLLGPNGAGKSTLLKAVAGRLAPLAGERLTAQGLIDPRAATFVGEATLEVPDLAPFAALAGTPMAGRAALRATADIRDGVQGFEVTAEVPEATIAGTPLGGTLRAEGTLAALEASLEASAQDARLATRARVTQDGAARRVEIPELLLRRGADSLRSTAPARILVGADGAVTIEALALTTSRGGTIRAEGRWGPEQADLRATLGQCRLEHVLRYRHPTLMQTNN